MRGSPLTPKLTSLSEIFFHIRLCRKPNERRSLMRRARLALAKRQDLTPAERHEIMCVWSRGDVSHIDSPALAKLLNRVDCGTYNRKAAPLYRSKFDSFGNRIPRKPKLFKPCTWFRYKQPNFLKHGQHTPPYAKKFNRRLVPKSSAIVAQSYRSPTPTPLILRC